MKSKMAKGQGKKTNRRARRGRNMNKPTTTIMSPLIAPDRAITKLKYQTRDTLTITAGAQNSVIFRGNGAYDPEYAAYGEQPTGYDQWAALYDKYTVVASSIKTYVVDVQGDGGDNETLLLAILPVTENSFTPTDINEVAALPYGKFAQIYPQTDGNPGAPSNTVRSYMSTEKIFGLVERAALIERNFSSATTASPNQGWYWTIFMQSANGTTSNQPDVYFEITYHVEFSDRITLTPSLLSYGMRSIRNLYDSMLEKQKEERRQRSLNKSPHTGVPKICSSEHCAHRPQC
jgi:hypothetical protein